MEGDKGNAQRRSLLHPAFRVFWRGFLKEIYSMKKSLITVSNRNIYENRECTHRMQNMSESIKEKDLHSDIKIQKYNRNMIEQMEKGK